MNEHLPPQDVHWPARTVFTVGHSTLPIERFILLLKTYDIKHVADIRAFPRSRHNPQYNSGILASSLAAEGIEYSHVPALGGLRHARKDSRNTGWRNSSFRGYADYMQTASFQHALEMIMQMSCERRVGMMCAEAVPWRCHRSLVADALTVHAVPVVEILSESSYRMHSITAFAKVEGTTITYPTQQTTLL